MNRWVQKDVGSPGESANIHATHSGAEQGRYGYDVITTTAATTAPANNTWCRIQAITSTVVASLTLASNPASSGSFSGLTISAGQSIWIQFTAITLTSGACICYRDR